MSEHTENGTGPETEMGRTDAQSRLLEAGEPVDPDELSDPVAVRLRPRHREQIEMLMDRYDLSQAEAVRLQFDMAGINPEQLEAVLARLAELDERVATMEQVLEDIADKYPGIAYDVDELLDHARQLNEGDEAPPWFTKHLRE